MPVTPGIVARFQQTLSSQNQRRIALAVSGGGDSIAMMHLAVRALGPERFAVFTVDHGLRPEAAEEIALVGAQATALGLPHHVTRWTWDGAGNLQNAARIGRFAALRALVLKHKRAEIWLGHTEDDQIETFLMRLARGSGVDGLAAMRRWSTRDSLPVFRPLLGIRRAELRDWLAETDLAWREDPSNDDARYDRIKARQMAAQLGDLGLTEKRILQTIDHMQAAQRTLQSSVRQFAGTHIRQEAGDLILAPDALDLAQDDAPRRAMAAAIGWISGGAYRPRFDALCDAVNAARDGRQMTLAGCLLIPQPDGAVRLTREVAATGAVDGIAPILWDKRWLIEGPAETDMTVKALGEDIVQCPDWRDIGLPRQSLMSSPSIWRGDTLLAAPVAGLSGGWSAQIVADFQTSVFGIED